MIELTEDQRKELKEGEPIRLSWGNRDVVLLRSDVFRRIQAVLTVERAVVEAGHVRGPVAAPAPLETITLTPGNGALIADVVALPASRFEEIQELVADDHERAAWFATVGTAQQFWARENPS